MIRLQADYEGIEVSVRPRPGACKRTNKIKELPMRVESCLPLNDQPMEWFISLQSPKAICYEGTKKNRSTCAPYTRRFQRG